MRDSGGLRVIGIIYDIVKVIGFPFSGKSILSGLVFGL
jgi:hypothetical protein